MATAGRPSGAPPAVWAQRGRPQAYAGCQRVPSGFLALAAASSLPPPGPGSSPAGPGRAAGRHRPPAALSAAGRPCTAIATLALRPALATRVSMVTVAVVTVSLGDGAWRPGPRRHVGLAGLVRRPRPPQVRHEPRVLPASAPRLRRPG